MDSSSLRPLIRVSGRNVSSSARDSTGQTVIVQGSTAKDAFFVKCDQTTTTQADIDAGVVNILVGFAPLKPAEFVIIKISQIAGQIQT